MLINNVLNNRELATAIWLAIFFLWTLSKSDFRRSVLVMGKAFADKKVFIPFLLMVIYIAATVLFFKRIGFWDISAIKDTIIWTFGSAFITFSNIHKIARGHSKFKDLLLDKVKFILILEFVVNLYSFSLIIELFLIPMLGFMGFLSGFADSKPKYRRVSKILNFILFVFGIIILIFTIVQIVNGFQNFASLKNLRDLLLPPLFSLTLLPFVYLMALYMNYEMFFLRIEKANNDPELQKKIKRMILLSCHINLPKLTKVLKKAGFPKVNDENDIYVWINED